MTIDGISYLNPNSINGLNLYAYCGNNPVMKLDYNGCFWTAIENWFNSVGNAISDFFTETAFVVNNVIESFYFNAGVGTGLGVGLEIGLIEIGLISMISIGMEAMPTPYIGVFQRILFQFDIAGFGIAYGIDDFSILGEDLKGKTNAKVQDFTFGIGASTYFALGAFFEIGFNISKFIDLMGR